VMQAFKTFINVINFATKTWSAKILWAKFRLRLEELGRSEASGAKEWAKERSEDTSSFMAGLETDLYHETCLAVQKIVSRSVPKVRHLALDGIDLGGGGSIDLIYFICRIIKPTYVLETGVAAGWSSYAILEALSKNRKGYLDSSDLPYFRIEDPEKYIGILVPDELRNAKNWRLETKGDSENLNVFLAEPKKFSVVHYDSDKRKSSRLNFLERIEPWLADNSVVIMDDIQDNYAFKEYVSYKNYSFKIFEYEGKFVGVIFKGSFPVP